MALALIAELGDDIGIELNVALAAFGLRQFETKREFIGLLQCATDLNFFLIEIEIGPAKGQEFAAAHAGCASGTTRYDMLLRLGRSLDEFGSSTPAMIEARRSMIMPSS
jgi:hypothetical protein